MPENAHHERKHKADIAQPTNKQQAIPEEEFYATSNLNFSLQRSPQLSSKAIIQLQSKIGNSATQQLLRSQANQPNTSNARSEVVQRYAETGTSASVDSARLQRYRQQIREYRQLVESGSLSREEIQEVDRAIQQADSAIRHAQEVADAGSGARQASVGALALTGGLAADDVTGIGVGDDIAIPFTLLAAGVTALVWLGTRNSQQDIDRAAEAARRAVDDTISTIGQIVLAQQVGNQVRGLAGQLLIHLARFLGEAVGGMPPDHQEDPERDRPHWWTEIKNFIRQIREKGLSPRQLLRELRKRFSDQQLQEMREALRRIAETMGEDPPDFPPLP